MPIYTYANFITDIRSDSSGIKNIQRLANRAARFVVGDIDLRSTKRRAYLSPNIHEEQFDYQAPSDLKEWAIVDIRRIADRSVENKFRIVSTEYFDRYKTYNKNLICIEDRDWLKKLRVSADLLSGQEDTTDDEGDEMVIHTVEDIDEDGTWAASGDASNLTEDTTYFANGDASLNFDVAISYTSAVLTNPDMDAVDLSDYTTGGSVFVFVYVSSTSGLSSFKLRIGSDASNYYEKSVTVTNENLAFHTGWNLLRFDLASATESGTADDDNIDYLYFEIVGDGTASAATTDWRLDYIVARRGIPHEVWYYTKYPWQSSAGTYLENSTATTDLLNADTEEYELFILKGKEVVARELKEFEDANLYRQEYEVRKANYETKCPTERLQVIQEYYTFRSNINESFLD